MLSASEFTVGSIGHAAPLTLVLPRYAHEETILIGHCPNGPAAFFLSERHQFQWFESADNGHWHGLLIPNIRIEVDEASIFDPNHIQPKLGTVVRKGTQLVVKAKANSIHSFGGLESVVLEDGLSSTSDEAAGFLRWQIVLGSGPEKRVLHEVSIERT